VIRARAALALHPALACEAPSPAPEPSRALADETSNAAKARCAPPTSEELQLYSSDLRRHQGMDEDVVLSERLIESGRTIEIAKDLTEKAEPDPNGPVDPL